MEVTDSEYSPFDAPVREPKTIKPETAGGVKMEEITEAELTGGGASKPDIPGDAPTFEIPKYDEIPDANLSGGGSGFGQGDPMAPGSSGSGGGNKTGGASTSGNGNAGNSSEGTKVENGFAKEFSEYTAKWLVDIFFKLLVAGFTQYAKIDKVEVVRAINEGHINERFLKYVDDANDKVDKQITVTEDEKKFVIEPLKYFLEVKKVQLKPEWMFITGLLMVGGGLFIKAQDVKNQNKVMLDQIIKESQAIRAQQQAEADSKIRKNPTYNENVENFTDPVNFGAPTPKQEKGFEVAIETVEAEEVGDGNNAQ